jgi:hypothetical protein
MLTRGEGDSTRVHGVTAPHVRLLNTLLMFSTLEVHKLREMVNTLYQEKSVDSL